MYISPESVEEIGYYAFLDCTALEKLVIPASVTEVYDGSFDGCSTLSTVIYKGTSDARPEQGLYSNFDDCPALKPVIVPEDYQDRQFCRADVVTGYEITWYVDGEIFCSEMQAYESAIVPPAQEPVKEKADCMVYTFAGWSETEDGDVLNEFPVVSAQADYYAVFEEAEEHTALVYNPYALGTHTAQCDECGGLQENENTAVECTVDPETHACAFCGQPEVCYVTFMNGDQEFAKCGCAYNERLVIWGMPVPEAPEGKVWDGWYTEDGVEIVHGMTITENLTAYATWKDEEKPGSGDEGGEVKPSVPSYDHIFGNAYEQQSGKLHYRVVCRKLNLRAGAGTEFDKIGTLKRGAVVCGKDLGNGWLEIRYAGDTAYVNADYLEVCSDEACIKVVTVICRKLNVRAEAGTEYDKVSSAARGEELHVVEAKNGWYKIIYGDEYGWICDKYAA